MGAQKSFLDAIINWKKVSAYFKEFSEDESKLDEIIKKRIIETIKIDHPDDYSEYIKKNKKIIEERKKRYKEKYLNDLEKINNFLSPPDRGQKNN